MTKNASRDIMKSVFKKANQAPLAKSALHNYDNIIKDKETPTITEAYKDTAVEKVVPSKETWLSRKKDRWIKIDLTQYQLKLINDIVTKTRLTKKAVVLSALNEFLKKYQEDGKICTDLEDEFFDPLNGITYGSLMVGLSSEQFDLISEISRTTYYSKRNIILMALYNFLACRIPKQAAELKNGL